MVGTWPHGWMQVRLETDDVMPSTQQHRQACCAFQLLMTRRHEPHQQLLLHAFHESSHCLPAKMMISS